MTKATLLETAAEIRATIPAQEAKLAELRSARMTAQELIDLVNKRRLFQWNISGVKNAQARIYQCRTVAALHDLVCEWMQGGIDAARESVAYLEEAAAKCEA